MEITSPSLRTSRLALRPTRSRDLEDLFRYRSDPEANQYQGWIPETPDDAKEFITRVEFDRANTWFQFALISLQTDRLVGDIGVYFSAYDDAQVELGCTLDTRAQGQGLATEALEEVINHLASDRNKKRFVASIDPRNAASVALFERLGFVKEAHFKESMLVGEEWVDDCLYGLSAEQWKTRRRL